MFPEKGLPPKKVLVKPAEYSKHLADMSRDRPKTFALSGALTTADYVALWCRKNSLALEAQPKPQRQTRERRK